MMTYFPNKFIAGTTEYTTMEKHVNAPYFRKKFLFEQGKTAQIRICGLGFYELYINGKNVTKGRLAPYISNPDQALYYDDYDVTEYLSDGENALGVWLGNGMQNAPYGDVWDFDKTDFRSAPKFAMAFCVDGEIVFESDESFLTKPSPITFDDLRAGEHYDARQETPDWNLPSADESGWKNAIFAVTPKGECKVVEAEPILVHGEMKPVSVTKTPKGVYLYDFGENFTGVCRLKISGARGQMVRLTHGEVIIDGELDMRNIVNVCVGLRKDFDQCDEYTLKGEGVEEYTPRFTYHGFQYVAVEGIADEQATLDLLTYEIMYSAVQSRGNFVCSDKVANAIQESIRRSDLSNLFYIPTDCPHREKNGWTGDVALSAEQMLLNFTVEKTFADWLFSVRNAQDERGAIPGIVPTGGWGFEWGAGPNWDDALIELLYQMYRYTGETAAIKDNIAAIEKYLAYMQSKRNADGLFEYGLGDWAQVMLEDCIRTPVEVTDSLKCIDICEKTAMLAELIGKTDLSEKAKAFAETIRQSFKAKYIRDGKLTVEEQTALAYALYYKAAEEYTENMQKQLLDVIARDGDVFIIGVLGARTLFRVLSDMGENDLAYKLITQPKFPSYGFHVLRGATSLFEQFYPLKEGAWQKANGSSHDSLNHHFWGDVSAWFIIYLAGINVAPDFCPNHVTIAPNFIAALQFAEGKFTHTLGEIVSRWERRSDGKICLDITLPEGVEAKLRLPKEYGGEERPLCAGTQQIIL